MAFNVPGKLIVVTTPGLSGGRAVATNLSLECDAPIVYLLPSYTKSENSGKWILGERKYSKYPDYLLALCRLLFLVIKRKDVKIVAEGFIPALSLAILKLFIGNRIILTTRMGRHWNDHKFKILWQLIFKFSDNVVTPLFANKSANLPQKIIKKLRYVPNPVRKIVKRQNKNVVADKVICIARAEKSKRIELVIPFMARLSEKLNCSAILYIQGNGRYYNEVCALSEAHAIKIYPFIDDVSEIYSTAKVLINFAVYEGFSMVTYEAAQVGIPTISLDCISGQNEMISKYNYGCILETSEQVDDAADYIRNLHRTELILKWNYKHEYFPN